MKKFLIVLFVVLSLSSCFTKKEKTVTENEWTGVTLSSSNPTDINEVVIENTWWVNIENSTGSNLDTDLDTDINELVLSWTTISNESEMIELNSGTWKNEEEIIKEFWEEVEDLIDTDDLFKMLKDD